jgi:hypothetical protein
MNKEFDEPHIYKPLMAGLLTGIIATLLNIFYEVVYRDVTGFSLSEIINVSTIIFATVLALLIAGTIFAVIDRYTRHVQLIYILLFIILTLLCVRWAFHVHRTNDPALNAAFRGLFSGIVIISGGLASFLVPFLVKHEKIFM